jgi:octaprenyl-diphosphate synthase
MGDWLYMTAFDMTLREHNFDILHLLTNMTRLMTEGEIIQLGLKGNSRITKEEHLDIVRRKTAYMFSAAAEVGAIVAGATPEQRLALRDYGLWLGMAFQLVDDILDFISTEEELGKPVANDLREGKLTLPVIYLLEGGNSEHRRVVETIIREGGFKTISHMELLELLEKERALDRARAEARGYAQEAIRALSPFPQSDYKRALVSVSDFVVERHR